MESHWINHYSGKELGTKIGWVASDSVDDPTRNCGLLVPPWNGWRDWQCTVKSSPITCACEHPGQMYLQLRGVCPQSIIDRFYVPRNRMRSGAVHLLGLDTTIVEYDKEKLLWKLTEYSMNITATTSASLASYGLGSHEWIIENDNTECVNNIEAKKNVEMTGCKNDEYTCFDGQCIKKCSNIKETYSYKRVLKLTGCRDGEFTCSDGQCIREFMKKL